MPNDKGIRQGVNRKFQEMLVQLKDSVELQANHGKKFRRIILDWTVEQYACSMGAASTHYNHALISAKKTTPELVAGLGRPEGTDRGGRKPNFQKTATPVDTTNPFPFPKASDFAQSEVAAEVAAA